jgi:hypothetical protein
MVNSTASCLIYFPSACSACYRRCWHWHYWHLITAQNGGFITPELTHLAAVYHVHSLWIHPLIITLIFTVYLILIHILYFRHPHLPHFPDLEWARHGHNWSHEEFPGTTLVLLRPSKLRHVLASMQVSIAGKAQPHIVTLTLHFGRSSLSAELTGTDRGTTWNTTNKVN